MSEEEIMEKIILAAVSSANQSMPYFALENPTRETSLYGTDHAVLDSLNLVSFVFILEEQLKKLTGKKLTIGPNDILRQESPFSSLTNLAKFLKEKLGDD